VNSRRLRRALCFLQDSWTEHQALAWIWNIMITVHVGLGVAVLAGGSDRFSYPTYKPLLDLVNGRTWIWGAWVLAAAVLMTVPARWPQMIGLWIGMIWQIFWCSLFSVAVIQYPTSGATASVAYAGFAMIDAALLTARVIEHGKR
jgi:hypothetical protein